MNRTLVDSGIKWIGKIPNEWKIVQVKNLFNIGRGRVISQEELVDDGKYPVYSSQTKNNGCLGYISTYDFDQTQITWTTDGANAGTIFLRSGKHNCTNVCGTLNLKEALKNNNDYSYLKYILEHTCYYHKRADTNGFKIMNNEMAAIKICLPSKEEQKRIADYLDSKCSKIDQVIEDNNKAIELLEEYRKIIVEDILKKYNPSNIKIKYLLEKSKVGIKTGPFGSSLTGKTLDNSGYLVYSQANLISDNFSFSKNYISEETYKSLSSYAVNSGDILLSMMGTIGKCKIIPQNIKPGIMDSHIIKVRLDEKIIFPEYFSLIYDKDSTNIIYNQLLFNSKGSIMDGLNTSIVKELLFPIIDISKQKDFLKEVGSKIKQLDKVIDYRKKIIEKLEEYKKSLIYEVVTGKKEV